VASDVASDVDTPSRPSQTAIKPRKARKFLQESGVAMISDAEIASD
jgi:hypothetical protein